MSTVDKAASLPAEIPQLVHVDPMRGYPGCAHLETCLNQYQKMRDRLVGSYITPDKPDPAQITAAWLPVQQYTYTTYIQAYKRVHTGNAYREGRKSDRAGYICAPFEHKLYIPDIVDINHSKPIRTGRPMSQPYKRSVEEMGGAPYEHIEFSWPKCPLHYKLWWGIFMPLPRHQQGSVRVNHRLLGYIGFTRNGNYALYSQILGHGDYLRNGIMYRLHLAIMEWLYGSKQAAVIGLESLIYAGYYQGKEGLRMWKKRALFRPANLVIDTALLIPADGNPAET